MGDFLLLENFSISSQSPRLARALIFSHQYLRTWVTPALRATSTLHPPSRGPPAQPPPLVRDLELAVELLGSFVVAVQDEGGDGVVQRKVKVGLVQVLLEVPLEPQELDLLLCGLGSRTPA